MIEVAEKTVGSFKIAAQKGSQERSFTFTLVCFRTVKLNILYFSADFRLKIFLDYSL